MKATQGASYLDDDFVTDYQRLDGGHSLRVGVYHYFSFDSTPQAQAQHFIAKVGNDIGSLPIGLYVTYYGQYVDDPPADSVVASTVGELVRLLEAHYGRQVVVMGTPALLTTLAKVSPSSPRWVISAKRPTIANATYWQYATAKLPKGSSAEFRSAVFLGDHAAFAKQ